MSAWGPPSGGRYCPACLAIYARSTSRCAVDGEPLESFHRLLGDKFIVTRPIGRGGMGTVYEAVQRSIGRKVAVKLLHPELAQHREVVARFEREAAIAGQVDHPNAVTIYDSGRTDDGEPYIAMEYLEGETLAQRLAGGRPLPLEEALRLWVSVVQAIATAHGAGVIHRDIKPDNVFLARRPGPAGLEESVKVLDFGIATARQRQPHPARQGGLVGTLAYMAPEQLEGGEADARSDLYALGLVLTEMLAGRLPWPGGEGESWPFALRRLREDPLPLRALSPPCDVSTALEDTLAELLARDPAARPADARALLRRLELVPELTPLLAESARAHWLVPSSPPHGHVSSSEKIPDDPELIACLPTQSYSPSSPGQDAPVPTGAFWTRQDREDAHPHAEVRVLPPEPEPPAAVAPPRPRGLPLPIRLAAYAALGVVALLPPSVRLIAKTQAAPTSVAARPPPSPAVGPPPGPPAAARAAAPLRSLQVLFLTEPGRRPTSIRCEGAATPRSVEATCPGVAPCRVLMTLLPGDQCRVRSPGHRSKLYRYEELAAAGARRPRGGVRMLPTREAQPLRE